MKQRLWSKLLTVVVGQWIWQKASPGYLLISVMVALGIFIYYKFNKDKIYPKYIKLILPWKNEYWATKTHKCSLNVLSYYSLDFHFKIRAVET